MLDSARAAGSRPYDLAVVGAGIVGLAHALAAARRGLRVVVFDREARAVGASVRNFGFVTVTGQESGATWRRAVRSRDVWAEIAPRAGIRMEQEGLAVVARRPEARAVLEAFVRTEMGAGCELLAPGEARARFPAVAPRDCSAVLWSPHERRVESREAVPRLAAFLAEAMGVAFVRPALVRGVDPPRVDTTAGRFEAGAAVICPGDDFLSLFPERLAAYPGLTRCKLHMLRVAAPEPGFRLPGALMSDLSLVRYLGYAALPEAEALRARLGAEQPRHLRHGVHLIAVQRASDGSMVAGDSHHYGEEAAEPFAADEVDALILDELAAALGRPAGRVLERWTGTYASMPDRAMLVDRPSAAVRVVVVTSGTGASTGFAIGEEVVAELFGGAPAATDRAGMQAA